MSSPPQLDSYCTLCGLMCDVADDLTDRCERRARWLSRPTQLGAAKVSPEIAEKLQRVPFDRRTLLWLDACDVQTVRAAVTLAQACGATIHVGQSTGAHVLSRVMSSDGWFGTTLSEIPARADLIVTLGDSLCTDAPLLAERFFRPAGNSQRPHWLHISAQSAPSPNAERDAPAALASEASGRHNAADERIHWPREQWFDNLTEVALQLSQPPGHKAAPRTSLVERLRLAKQAVWLWDVDELHFQTDELLIRRLASIARLLNEQSRCSLLPLNLHVGRVTADEALLWLTGCSGTAQWDGRAWQQLPMVADYSLEQWSSAYRSIVLVNNLATDRPLPNLPTSLQLCTKAATNEREIQVASVGDDAAGHLFRGDRGSIHYLGAGTPSNLPSAASVLERCGG